MAAPIARSSRAMIHMQAKSKKVIQAKSKEVMATAMAGLPWLVFVVAVACLPGVPSATTAPRWAVLSGAVPLMLWSVRVTMTPGHWLGLGFVAWAGAGLAWSVSPWDTVGELWRLAVLAGSFCLGAVSRDLTRCWTMLAAGVSVSAAVAILQEAGVTPIFVMSDPPVGGLFANKNVLAELAAASLVAVLALRSWRWVPGPLLATVLPASRGVLVALALTGLYALVGRMRWRWIAFIAMVSAIAIGGALLLDLQLPGRVTSLNQRLAIWHNALFDLRWFGWGLGSSLDYAHNELLHLALELGLGSLLLWVSFGYAIGGPLVTERLVLVTILAEGLFAFPLHMPATAFLAALCAGRLCGARHALRGVGHGRRAYRRANRPPLQIRAAAGNARPAAKRRRPVSA